MAAKNGMVYSVFALKPRRGIKIYRRVMILNYRWILVKHLFILEMTNTYLIQKHNIVNLCHINWVRPITWMMINLFQKIFSVSSFVAIVTHPRLPLGAFLRSSKTLPSNITTMWSSKCKQVVMSLITGASTSLRPNLGRSPFSPKHQTLFWILVAPYTRQENLSFTRS